MIELARLRLRGVYVIVAGALLLLVGPAYQALVLGFAYSATAQAIDMQHTFGPYLLWISQNVGNDRLFRLIDLLAFVLAVTLPGPLVKALYPEKGQVALLARLAGWLGFGLYALALLVGVVTSATAASAYAAATSASARASVASGFAANYAFETILSRVIGGLLLAIFVGVISTRLARTGAAPRWMAFIGLVVALVTFANAVLFALQPTRASTLTSALAAAGLALWLGIIGVLLTRARVWPLVELIEVEIPDGAPTQQTPQTPQSPQSPQTPTAQPTGPRAGEPSQAQ
ncbi:MAG: hypothetical protein ABI068_18095 [Ktedonobacterales bacterium]